MTLIRTFGELPPGFHGSGISGIVVDAEGRWMLVASESALRLWTVATREPVVTLSREHASGVALLDDGLAAAASRGRIRFWRVPGGEPEGDLELPADAGAPTRPAVLSNGGTAAVAFQGEVHVWDLRARESRGAFAFPEIGQPRRFALTRDGRRLLVWSDRRVDLWDIAERRRLGAAERLPADGHLHPLGDGRRALSVRTSDAAGNVIAHATRHSRNALDEITLDEPSGRTIRRLLTRVHVFAVADSPDGTLAAVVNRQLVAWRPDGTRVVTPDRSPEQPLFGTTAAIALTPDGRTLVAGDSDGWLTRWNAADLEPLDRKPRFLPADLGRARGTSIAIVAIGRSRDSRRVIAVTDAGWASVWDLESGAAIARGDVGERVVAASGLGEDGFATLHDARERRPPYAGGFVYRLWSPALQPLGELRVPGVAVLAADGSGLAAHASGTHVRVIALPGLESRLELDTEEPVSAVSLSPDGGHVAWASAGPPDSYSRVRRRVAVHEVPSGNVAFTYGDQHASSPVHVLTLTGVPRFCGIEGSLYDLESGQGAGHVFSIGDPVWAVAPGDRMRRASSANGLSSAFVSAGRREPGVPYHEQRYDHGSRVRSLCWVDERRLAVGGEDGMFSLFAVA